MPSDPRIRQLALILAGLGSGVSHLRGDGRGGRTRVTCAALTALGVRIEGAAGAETEVHGAGLFGLRPPDAPLDCGVFDAVATGSLLAGILATQPFVSSLLGASREALAPLVAPLRARGAVFADDEASLRIGPLPPADKLRALEYASPGGRPEPEADFKAALLLSGLFAHGATYVSEPTLTRDHAERMLQALGAPIETHGTVVRLDPANWSGQWGPLDVDVPGDLSAAAYLLVAAQIIPGSRVTARGVGVNPTRAGVLEVLRDAGAGLAVEAAGDRLGEPVADLHAWPSAEASLRAFHLGGELAARAVDDLGPLAVLACFASGTSVFQPPTGAARGAASQGASLPATWVNLVGAFGVSCEERRSVNGVVEVGIRGMGAPATSLASADVDGQGDAALVMIATLLGLRGRSPTRVRGADCLAWRYPRFVGTLRALGARIDVVDTAP